MHSVLDSLTMCPASEKIENKINPNYIKMQHKIIAYTKNNLLNALLSNPF